MTVNGRTKRRKKAEQRRNDPKLRAIRTSLGPLCLNGCGERGPHFVPPSMGERGFFICKGAES